MVTRDLSNKRIQIGLAPASALSAFTHATDTELASFLFAAPAIRWDGLDFGMQESEQIDDRSLDDDATATLRGFMQFGGGIPFFYPKVTDLSSVLRDVFDLVSVRGTELALIERVGFVDRRQPFAAGDNINIYKVMTDGFQPDTEGTGGYVYVQSMIPRGDVAPYTIVADDPAVAITISGGAVTGAVGGLALRRASYIGNDITNRATWTTSNPAVALVNDGIIEMVGTGSANVSATFPGATAATPITVTVS